MRRLAALFASLLLVTQAAALELKPGVALPLSSGAAPAFAFFEVQHAPSTGQVDVLVVFDAPPAPTDSRQWEYLDYGELCLRYGAELLTAAVQAEELPLLRVMAVIYRRPEDVGINAHVRQGIYFPGPRRALRHRWIPTRPGGRSAAPRCPAALGRRLTVLV